MKLAKTKQYLKVIKECRDRAHEHWNIVYDMCAYQETGWLHITTRNHIPGRLKIGDVILRARIHYLEDWMQLMGRAIDLREYVTKTKRITGDHQLEVMRHAWIMCDNISHVLNALTTTADLIAEVAPVPTKRSGDGYLYIDPHPDQILDSHRAVRFARTTATGKRIIVRAKHKL